MGRTECVTLVLLGWDGGGAYKLALCCRRVKEGNGNIESSDALLNDRDKF